MILYYTPKSHFSRKVWFLMDLLELPYELVDIGNVAESNLATFNSNPLMKVPVLQDKNNWIVDSDHIASYIVRTYAPEDKYNVLTTDLFDLNARAIMNGIMLEEVKLILAQRTGVPTPEYAFFQKAQTAMANGLEWIEHNIQHFGPELTYREIHLICLWDHLKMYNLIPLSYPKTQALIEDLWNKQSWNGFVTNG